MLLLLLLLLLLHQQAQWGAMWFEDCLDTP